MARSHLTRVSSGPLSWPCARPLPSPHEGTPGPGEKPRTGSPRIEHCAPTTGCLGTECGGVGAGLGPGAPEEFLSPIDWASRPPSTLPIPLPIPTGRVAELLGSLPAKPVKSRPPPRKDTLPSATVTGAVTGTLNPTPGLSAVPLSLPPAPASSPQAPRPAGADDGGIPRPAEAHQLWGGEGETRSRAAPRPMSQVHPNSPSHYLVGR